LKNHTQLVPSNLNIQKPEEIDTTEARRYHYFV
jgi:hypothetical protein